MNNINTFAKYKNDCSHCFFLGQVIGPNLTYDLYLCDAGPKTFVVRWGDSDKEVASGVTLDSYPFVIARYLAAKQGFMPLKTAFYPVTKGCFRPFAAYHNDHLNPVNFKSTKPYEELCRHNPDVWICEAQDADLLQEIQRRVMNHYMVQLFNPIQLNISIWDHLKNDSLIVSLLHDLDAEFCLGHLLDNLYDQLVIERPGDFTTLCQTIYVALIQ